ncbi:methionyl-tRNA formyltransferase [Malacoplasma muris]|uniref:methionyl-tRNA formyltransferase n=1 Tax=Malacoplasma muris TaxID=2119 RepID=UPI00398E88B5
MKKNKKTIVINSIKKRYPRVVFMGTPFIAVSALKALANRGYRIVAIVCQPDRPSGRKQTITFSPVKEFALKYNLKLFQPNKISDIYNELKNIKFDVIVTCAYGQFIPDKILNMPKYGCINVHASLLPKYRGGAPVHWALINGEKETGVTLMKTIKQMDAGDCYVSYKISILDDDNLKTLFKKIEKTIYLIIYHELENILNKKLTPIKQNEEFATKALNITKEQEKLTFNMQAKNFVNWVKGLYEFPCAYVVYENGMKIKLYDVEVTDELSKLEPGTITSIRKEGIFVSTLDYNVKINEFKIEGKKRINIKDFYFGNKLFKINRKFF